MMSERLSYANVVSTIAVFGVLTGGTAYAASTIGSSDIIDGQVKSVDIGNGEVNSADVKDQSLTTFDVSTFLGADIVDGSLTSADVAPGTFVEGRGQLLSNRIVFTPPQIKTLLVIPGLGQLEANCGDGFTQILWRNTTSGPVDGWFPANNIAAVFDPGEFLQVVEKSEDLMFGTGNDPGP